MAAVALFLKASLPLAQLVRIQLAVPTSASALAAEEEEPSATDIRPPPQPPQLAHLNSVLQRVAALQSSELPFVAWALGSDMVQVACAKAHVAKVFKLLYTKQQELGCAIKDVKSNVLLQPMPEQELCAACRQAVAAALQQRGWWRLDDAALLSGSLLGLADGRSHTVDSISLEVRMQAPDTVVLLLRAEVVKFRHTAARSSSPGVDLPKLGKELVGDICTVLPDFSQGLICGVRTADAATLGRLRPVWASYRLPLPEAIPYLVEVQFEDDPDAPAFAYPPCSVLSKSGLDPVHTRLDSSAVQAVLARVRDELAQTSFAFWGGSLKLAEAKVWYPDGPPPAVQAAQQQLQQPGLVFQTARQLAQPAAASQAVLGLALGPAVDVAGFSCGGANSSVEMSSGSGPSSHGVEGAAVAKTKKPHARAGPMLARFLQRIEEEEAASAAAKAAAAPPPKPAAPRCATAAGGPPAVTKFRSNAPPPAKAGAGPKQAAAGQKRAPGAKAAVPRAPKAAKAAAADQAPLAAGAGGPEPAGAPAAATGAPAVARAAAAAKPSKPRAPPKELVLEEVVGKVRAAHAAGKLGSLTIPEMKCYLKSLKKPVGGKKAELEERVASALAAEA